MGFDKEEWKYPSADGVRTVNATVYLPHKEPKAVVQISHGMCEYIDRYQPFMTYLAEHDFLVCGNDHIGHGRSIGSPIMKGDFGPENGPKNLVKDVHTLTKKVREQYPDTPYFLLGHSMGSFVARLYMAAYPDLLDGVILSGTAGPNPAVKGGILLARLIAATKGKNYRSVQLDKLAFGRFNDRILDRRTDKDWLTRDNQVVSQYRRDPNCMFLFTAKGYEDLFTMSSWANHPDWAVRVRKDLPILLLSGDMDPVGDYGKGVSKVYEMLLDAGVKDVNLRLYRDGRHEMLNEVNRDQVYADILQWILAHLPQGEHQMAMRVDPEMVAPVSGNE